MSDDIYKQGCSSKSDEFKELQKPSPNILSNNNSIKINEKFVLKLPKGSKNVNKEVKDSCKMLHFSSEWNFEEVLVTIDQLNPKEYPQLFIFIIETANFGLTANNYEKSSKKLAKVHESLLKFGSDRPMIIQLTSEDEDISKIYHKEESLNLFAVVDQQQDESEELNSCSSFLRSFFKGEFDNSEIEILDAVQKLKNCSLVLRFLQTLNLSDGFFGSLILNRATEGSKSEFLAALDSPFDSNGRILSIRAQKYISVVFGDDDDPKNDDSVLLTAISNKNAEVIDYLITYWTYLIQQLPFDHQVRISTAAFQTNQLDVLCDLLDIVDFPFPDDFKSESIEHPRLCEIIAERIDFKTEIEAEDFAKIDEHINKKPNLKFIYSPTNNSALTEAVNFKKFGVFYYLKSLGFQGEMCDEILSKLSHEEKEQAVKLATERRKLNVNKSEDIAPSSVMQLSMRSSVHNSRTERMQASKYREKIMKWFTDIHKVAPKLIDVAASCNDLKIIFDFESDSVENVSLTGSNAAGSMYPSSNWIFVGAKLTDSNGNTTKQRKQQIKGFLAHELCHYVMKLVYENQENPYFKYGKDVKEKFEEIVKIINKWSSEDSGDPDDKCNGIISSVFKLYDPKDFHPELIVRAVQILSEFDDSENKSKNLEEKYEILFDFWHGQVIPELQKYLERNKEIIRLNRTLELLPCITKLKYELSNRKDMENMMKHKIVIVQSNVPKLLFLNIHKNLREKSGNLFDSQNIFVDPEMLLKNQQLWDDFKQICCDNQELSIFVDCLKEIPDGLGNIFVNKELNFIFVVSNEVQCEKLNEIFKEQEIINAQKVEINYNFRDLTEESQELLLKTEINFQNNSQITLKDLIHVDLKECDPKSSEATENGNEDKNDLFDDQLLNLILKNQQVLINSREKDENSEKYFQLLFKQRNFVKKTRMTDEESKLDNKNENSELSYGEEEPSGFWRKLLGVFGKNKSEALSSNQNKIKEQKMLDVELFSEVKNQKYVLISDQAGNGKSWAMKNFTKFLREPTKWVTYVDLKQFIDVFKKQQKIKQQKMEEETFKNPETTQNVEHEFSSFMIENILKLQQKFEEKIFQKLYKNGKVLILFDGFDEIAPNCAEFVSKLTQNFQQNGGNQMWIATRDFFEVDLKEKLELNVAYRLDEMTENEGVDLIAKSWVLMDLIDIGVPKSKEDFEESLKISPNLEVYQQKARQIIKTALISRNSSVGLPQLFKMIADGFKDEDNLDDLQGSKIYVKFIDILYIRWSRKKGQIREDANVKSQLFKLSFYKFHQYHATLSLFPELVKILFPGYNGSEWPEEEVIACGILTKRNGILYFIHETFREYFVADAIAIALSDKEVEKKVIKFVDEILTVHKFKIIRAFLFPILNKNSLLEKFKPKIQKLILREEELFSEIFIENHDNLADFAIKVVKNEKYENVKAILETNVSLIVSNGQNSKMISKFIEVLFVFLKVDDLKDLIIKYKIVHQLIKSCLKIEIFEYFMMKIEAKIGREFVRQGLMLLSDENKRNIFYSLSESSNLNAPKFNKFLEIMEKFLTVDEIFELLSKCSENEQNILQVFFQRENKENLKKLVKEIEKYFAGQNYPQSFKELVKQRDGYKQNILHYVSCCDDFEVHEYLWELLLKSFEDQEKLKYFILQMDRNGNNFVHELVGENKNPSIIELTFKILKENFTDAQFQDILTSKGFYERNLLHSAAGSSKVIKVHQLLWKFFRDFSGTDEKFLEMLKEVDKNVQNILHSTVKRSSSEVFEFMIQELEKIASRDKIRKMLRNLNKWNQSLLQTAAEFNKSLELHKTLWQTFRKYFEKSEILEFIKNVDYLENNLLFNAVCYNTKEIVELTWNEIKSFLNHDEQIEFLKMKGKYGKNLIQISRYYNYREDVKKYINNLMEFYKINL